jgi:hypothetical protein
MTKKDYILIAALLAEVRSRYAPLPNKSVSAAKVLADVTTGIADILARDNPRFDRARFFEACGL